MIFLRSLLRQQAMTNTGAEFNWYRVSSLKAEYAYAFVAGSS